MCWNITQTMCFKVWTFNLKFKLRAVKKLYFPDDSRYVRIDFDRSKILLYSVLC